MGLNIEELERQQRSGLYREIVEKVDQERIEKGELKKYIEASQKQRILKIAEQMTLEGDISLDDIKKYIETARLIDTEKWVEAQCYNGVLSCDRGNEENGIVTLLK